MKYNVTLNNKVYEVEVERGEAILHSVSNYVAPPPAAAPVAVAAPAPAATAAPVPAPAPAAAPPAPAPAVPAGGEAVKAPMPGVVLKVNVSSGDKVKAGQIIMILEAMKMENEIAAPRDGTVSQIVAERGASVETGSPLIILT